MCKVTIIVPVYNVEKYLKECLESLIHQTLSDIEIICVNDGSTDNSRDILADYQRIDSRIRVINQRNAGLSAARNSGLDVAKGEYIYFCDSDDYLRLDAMEVCYSKAKNNNVEVLRFGYYAFEDGVEGTIRTLSCMNTPDSITGIEMLDLVFQSYNPSIPILFIKRSYLEEHGYHFIEGIIHEDHSFFVEVLMTSSRTIHIDVPLYYRRIRSGSIMTTLKPLASARGMLTTLKHTSKTYAGLKDRTYDNIIVDKYFNFFFSNFLTNYILLQRKEKKMFSKEFNELRIIMKKYSFFHNRSAIYLYYGRGLYLFYRNIVDKK